MSDRIEFDGILDEVLREIANPEPTGGLQQRMMRQVRMAVSAERLVEDAARGRSWRYQPERASRWAGVPLFEADGGEGGIFGSLWNGVRDLFFPAKLPPLVLESRPIAVIDRMAAEKSYPSTVYAVACHVFVIVVIGFAVNAQIRKMSPARENVMAMVDPPLALRAAPKADEMGGGGGQKGLTPASRGALPKLEQEPLTAPKIPPLETPMLAVDPSVDMQKDLKMAALPNLGMPNSPLVSLSMGDGRGAGLGPGDGNGVGPGSGGNIGNGVKQVGGGVSAPVLVFAFEPEFSEEARRAKFSGNVIVGLWVDERGNPSHVHVIRAVGMGLDERAVAAVKQYRFKPAMENGKPVMVEMDIEVTFSIL
jgi:periplasmic protein TonB